LAVDPKISSFGSGSVKIKAYKGRMSSDGMASVEVGGHEMSSKSSKHHGDNDDDNDGDE
jgi:hypothetical protein